MLLADVTAPLGVDVNERPHHDFIPSGGPPPMHAFARMSRSRVHFGRASGGGRPSVLGACSGTASSSLVRNRADVMKKRSAASA
jgi:hypothetical protein